MYNLGSLFRIHSLEFISFRLPRFQHHNLKESVYTLPSGGTLKFSGILRYCFALTIAPMKIDEVFGFPGS
jgi:hypothetical protein